MINLKMEIITKAYIVHSIDDIEEINIRVTELNFLIVRRRLELERNKIIDMLKQMKNAGAIKSIWIPKNKKLQKELNNLTTCKRQLKNSIEKIKAVF